LKKSYSLKTIKIGLRQDALQTTISNFETFLVTRFHPKKRPKRVFQQAQGHIASYAETEHLTRSLVIWEYHDHYRQS